MQFDPTPEDGFTVADARHLFDTVVDDVDDAARFVVRNKMRILAIPVTIVSAAAAVGLDVSHLVPHWLAGALGVIVAAAGMVTGATKIAAKYATTADPTLVPRDLDGGVLLNASEAVALVKTGNGAAQVDDDEPVATAPVVGEDGQVDLDVPVGGQLLDGDTP